MPPDFTPINPQYRELVNGIFQEAEFIRHLGARLVDFGPGWVESAMDLKPEHLQQNGFVHAGVVSTLADHSSGACAGTLVEHGKKVLTVEYKINLLRPAVGQSLRCRAELLKAGKNISFSESEVYAIDNGAEKLVAKASVTLAIV